MERLSFTLALLFCSASSYAASLTAVPNTYPYAVSADGSTIVGRAWEPGDQHSQAFRWTSSAGLQRLGRLPGDYTSDPVAASADGSVVAGNSLHWEPIPGDPDGLEAYRGFRWTAATGLTDLGLLPGALTTEVRAMSADGSAIFGHASFPNYFRAPFRWTAQTGIALLDSPAAGPADQIWVSDVSADGSVALLHRGAQPLRWTAAGGITLLPGLAAGSHYGYAMSDDGSTVVGHARIGSTSRTFRWSDRTQAAEYIADFGANVRLVSADGGVLAGHGSVDGVGRSFRWTEAIGLQFLERPPGTRSNATFYPTAMSADGSVLVGRLNNSFWNGSTWTGHDAYVWTAETGSTRLTALLESYGIGLPTGWYWLELDDVSADGTTFVGRAARSPYGEFSVIVTIPEPSLLPFILALIPPLLRRRPPAAARRGGTIRRSDVSLQPGGHP